MGRIVGDGAINFDIVDVAVDPAHRGKGLGRLVMEKLVARLDANAFDGAYVTLVADVPELYAKFGFESVRPESEGWPASGEPAVVSSHFLPEKSVVQMATRLAARSSLC